ncbi:MAG: hypothetical protein Q8O89_04700 [Nanoarchaeota archaeon]|nr:hypothetical protein [Nanoarchaeota archaeon]
MKIPTYDKFILPVAFSAVALASVGAALYLKDKGVISYPRPKYCETKNSKSEYEMQTKVAELEQQVHGLESMLFASAIEEDISKAGTNLMVLDRKTGKTRKLKNQVGAVNYVLKELGCKELSQDYFRVIALVSVGRNIEKCRTLGAPPSLGDYGIINVDVPSDVVYSTELSLHFFQAMQIHSSIP